MKDRVIDVVFAVFSAIALCVVLVAADGIWAPYRSTKVAMRFLRESGYTKIAPVGTKWFTCDEEGGTVRVYFEAVSPVGEKVNGDVCVNWVSGHSTLQ